MEEVTALILGLGAGLLGLALGLGVMLALPLGLFNRLLVVRPEPGLPAVARVQLLEAILALNDDRRPWAYRSTPEDRRADLVAEWKLADARWWGAFQRNGLRRSYRAWVALDEATHELRVGEATASVSWSAGTQGLTPAIHWRASFFRGVILFERTREIAYGIRDELPPAVGEIYNYDFDPWRVKAPLLRLALEHGWSYCPVVHRFQLGRRAA